MNRPIPALCLLASLFVSAGSLMAGELEPLLDSATLWSIKPEAFIKKGAPLGFVWTSSAHDSARAAEPIRAQDRQSPTFLDEKVYETVARFDGDTLKEVTVLFFGRGDAGDLTKAAFEELLRKTIAGLDAYTGKKFTPRGRDTQNAVKADGVTWQTDTTLYTLEYSFTKENKAKNQEYRPEFIRLEITRPTKPAPLGAIAAAAKPTAPAKKDLRAAVQRDTDSGDVFVPNIPMVDQGQKGYCVVACTERMLRFYGVSADENEMAQIANTRTEGGTNSREMFEALKKLTARFRVRVTSLEEMSQADYHKLFSDYDREAKKAKKKPLPDLEKVRDLGEMYGAMDPEVVKEVRTKNAAATSHFLRDVQSHIDAGVPLCWTVHLGFFPEPGVPQSGGGHMRLIIGYNTKTSEIIFSDSWGAGHEKKRMPLDNAWTITTGLTAMEPVGG